MSIVLRGGGMRPHSLCHGRTQKDGQLQGNPHWNTSSGILMMALLSFRIMRKTWLPLKPPRWQHFVTAVPAGYDSVSIRGPVKVTLGCSSFSSGNNLAGLVPCPLTSLRGWRVKPEILTLKASNTSASILSSVILDDRGNCREIVGSDPEAAESLSKQRLKS